MRRRSTIRLLIPVSLSLLWAVGCDQRPADANRRTAAVSATRPAARATGAVPSLQAQLDARRAAFEREAPPELAATFSDGIDAVRTGGVEQRALKVGAKAPDFTLPAADGGEVSLATLRENGPVVVAWYRGGWCPYCMIQLNALQDALPRFESHGASLIAIAPETPEKTAATRKTHGLTYPILSDSGNNVAAQYGLVYTLPEPVQQAFEGRIDLEEYNADASAQLPLSATYVIDDQGIIRYAFIEADYRRRAEPAEILQVLSDLNE